MARYPIHAPRDYYGGSKERLRAKAADYNRRAKILEEYVNRKVEEEEGDRERCVLLYYSIAHDCGMTTEAVREVLFEIGGYNGVTVYGGPKEKAGCTS